MWCGKVASVCERFCVLQDSGSGSDRNDDEEDEDQQEDSDRGAKRHGGDEGQSDGAGSLAEDDEDEASGGKDHGDAMEEGDEMLTCRDCDKEFAFTVGEQEFFKQKVRITKNANSACMRPSRSHLPPLA
jgi:hypothetical protein